MVSNLNRSFIVTLALGLVMAGAGTRGAEAAQADYPPLDSYGDSYGNPYGDSYSCLNNLCVGMTARVVGGDYAGYSGRIVAIDQYQDTITLSTTDGYSLYARSYDVIADVTQPSSSGCVANICIGDQVLILVGVYNGRIGQIVDTDDYNYTATILIDGRYIIEDIRDLSLSTRPSQPRPYPNYPRNCPIGYIYDIYRGCIQISYPYPRPFPHPTPYPRPLPRPYPAPRGYPQPPRPSQGYPQPPRPSQGYPQPPRPSQGYPQPPRPSQGYPQPPRPSQGYPQPPRPSQGYPQPPRPSQGYPQPSRGPLGGNGGQPFPGHRR